METGFLNVGTYLWGFLKWIYVIALLVYVVFAFVVVRQVTLMTNTLEVGYEKGIKVISVLHLAVSIFILLLAIIIL